MMRAVLCACVVAGAALCAAPLPAEVKSASDAGFVIENVAVAPVDAATAWRALVEDVDLWWPKDHTFWGEASKLSIEPRAGGCFCEIAGARQVRHLVVVFVDPRKTLRLTGGLGPFQAMGFHGALEWRLEPVEGGTRVTLRYQGGAYSPDDLSELAPVVDRVQGQQLGGLIDYLRDRPQPSPRTAPGPETSPARLP